MAPPNGSGKDSDVLGLLSRSSGVSTVTGFGRLSIMVSAVPPAGASRLAVGVDGE
jgi:hypothetical protein